MQDFHVRIGDRVTFAKTVGETDIYLSLCRHQPQLEPEWSERHAHGRQWDDVGQHHLLGTYLAGNFTLNADGRGGTLVVDPPASSADLGSL
jgi:hypothetical protein